MYEPKKSGWTSLPYLLRGIIGGGASADRGIRRLWPARPGTPATGPLDSARLLIQIGPVAYQGEYVAYNLAGALIYSGQVVGQGAAWAVLAHLAAESRLDLTGADRTRLHHARLRYDLTIPAYEMTLLMWDAAGVPAQRRQRRQFYGTEGRTPAEQSAPALFAHLRRLLESGTLGLPTTLPASNGGHRI